MGHATACQLPACCLVKPSALGLQSAVGASLPFPPSSSIRCPGMAPSRPSWPLPGMVTRSRLSLT